MHRYTRVPLTLYRIQSSPIVNLRDRASQFARRRQSFDLVVHDDGLVHPMAGDRFHTPNGMSLRPPGDTMRRIIEQFKGKDARVYRLQEYMELPKGLVILHEHTDHYSLQTSEPIPLADLNKKLTDFLGSLPSQTKQEWIEQYDDEDDQDN